MTVRILQGDALEQLVTLPDESVQCVVTSPPYYGLRDYGTAEWDGGEVECDHVESYGPPLNKSTLTSAGIGATPEGAASKAHAKQFRDNCGLCGATRIDRQLGLESTPAEYVDKMVDVFRDVRRVLRNDGVCWLNMGDSYAGSGRGGNPEGSEWAGFHGSKAREQSAMPHLQSKTIEAGAIGRSRVKPPAGLKAKDLIGVPWRLAFALQADGWWLRQDIIWHKPNPMPESVTDRCTKAHEYIFLLSKSERYYYDAAAIAEPASQDSGWAKQRIAGEDTWKYGRAAGGDPHSTNGVGGTLAIGDIRNKRSVWTITTEPYPEAHFATFPTELPRICILAGSKIGDTILDPFAGSGTTLQVAIELSRQAIGIELNADYVALANRRLNSTTLGLPLELAA